MLQISFPFGFGMRKVTSKCSNLTFRFYIGEIYYLMFQSIFVFESPMGKIDKLQLYRGSLWPQLYRHSLCPLRKYGKFSLDWSIPSHILIWNGFRGNMPFFPQRKHSSCSLGATLRVSLVPCVLFLGEFSHSGHKRNHVRIVQRGFLFFVFFKIKSRHIFRRWVYKRSLENKAAFWHNSTFTALATRRGIYMCETLGLWALVEWPAIFYEEEALWDFQRFWTQWSWDHVAPFSQDSLQTPVRHLRRKPTQNTIL